MLSDPAVSIPLHFSLEFLGVAAFGGLTAWAVYVRRPLAIAGSVAVLGAQVLHAGQLVSGEDHAVTTVLWLLGLALLAVSVHVDGRAEADGSPAAAPAAGGLSVATGVGAAALAALVAVGNQRVADRALWATAWAAIAASSLWFAAVDPGPALLQRDLGPHVVQALGTVVLGVWAWRRTARSLILKVLAAFAVVLFVVVVVAGGTVARVTAGSIEESKLDELDVQVRSQEALMAQTSDGVRGRAPDVATALAEVVAERGDVTARAAQLLESRSLTGVDFIVVAEPGPRVVSQVGGKSAEEAQTAARSPAATGALGGSPVVTGGYVVHDDDLLFTAAAPIPVDGVEAAAVLGHRVGAEELAELEQRAPDGRLVLAAAVVTSDGRVLAASERDLARAELPPEALRAAREAAVWRGTLSTPNRRYIAAAAAVERGGTAPAVIVVAAPDTSVVRTALDTSRAMFGAVLAAALVSILIALWLSSRIVRPVIDVTETARRVEEGDLAARTGFVSPDEIGTLAHAIDSMTSTVQASLAIEQDTRRRIEAIVAGMGEALVSVDPDFTIASFNPAAEAITGVPAAEALGATCYEVYGAQTAGPDGRPMCETMCPLRTEGGHEQMSFDRRDGDRLALAVTCSPLRDEDGVLTGGVDHLRNVTPEAEAERMKSNFLVNVSHELRTPLTPLQAAALTLARRNLTPDQSKALVQQIMSSSHKLERLVRILEDTANFDAGRLQLARRTVPPGDLVRAAVARWRERAPNHNVRAGAASSLPEVDADPRFIDAVLDELIDNAVKFSRPGTPIAVTARDVRGGVEITVTDRGRGMEQAELEELMAEVRPDRSIADAPLRGAGGLGLTYVRRVLREHGTDLTAEVRSGKGSAFAFVLPRARKTARRSATSKRRAAPRKAR